jgi:hypothetical protein
LNHFTVPCSFTAEPRIEIALPLLASDPDRLGPEFASSPEKKGREFVLAAP